MSRRSCKRLIQLLEVAASIQAESARQAITTRLSILSPEEDEPLLREAGFSSVSLFYAGLSFRGWAGYA